MKQPMHRPHAVFSGKCGLSVVWLTSCLGTTAVHAADVSNLEEIIVTAQKRSERLLDVPISIEAVTAEDIARRGLTNGEDYLRGVPSVNQIEQFNGTAVVIRGLATTGGNGNVGSTVATYFGETPITASGPFGAADIKLVDIQRVEVLRGPQGTSFGSSSVGGAVRLIPSEVNLKEIEGNIKAGYSVTSGTGDDNYLIQGVANIPIVQDKFGIRLVGYRFDDSGYIHNVAGSDPGFQAYSATFGVQSFAVDDDDIGATRTTGGRVSASLQPIDNLKLAVSYLKQETELDGWAHTGADNRAVQQRVALRDYEQAIWQVAPEFVVRGEKAGVFDPSIELGNATVEYGFSWGSLLATFSRTESDNEGSTVAGVGTPWSGHGLGAQDQNSGELRLTTDLGGAWNFLVGMYGEELKDRSFNEYAWFGSTASRLVAFPASTSSSLGSITDKRTLKQKAAFAEATWEFLPKFSLTGGVRRYDYDRSVSTTSSGVLLGNVIARNTMSASGTNGRANLSYKPNDNTLLYLGWAEGFRLGAPQRGLDPGTCDRNSDGLVDGTNVTIASTRVVDSDSVDSYELGTKLALMGRRLTISGAVYKIDWDKIPLLVTAPVCLNGYTTNAGTGRSRGVELDVGWYLTDALRMDFGGSYMEAELVEDVPNLPVPAFKGNGLPRAPDITANLGLQYEFRVGASYDAFVRADSFYVSEFYSLLQQVDATRAGDYVKVDASAGIALNNLSVELFVRNLTDEDAFTFRGANAAVGDRWGFVMRPRTIGLHLGYTF